MNDEVKVYMEAVTGERKPKPLWMVNLGFFFDDLVHRIWHGYGLEYEKPEQKDKLQKLYDTMMVDIQASDAPEAIKEGLDPLPAMVGYLLAAAGGGAVGMILSSLLTPYISAKLTYPMNKMATPFRLDPNAITQLWLRGFPFEHEKEKWWDDLKDQGWDEERIAAAKELAHILPSPSDAIGFLAHEVYEEDMVTKYGLDDEFGKLDLTTLNKIGIDKKLAKQYWRDHWKHTSFMQMVEMRRRELITDEDIWEWFKLVEVPPHWRDKLIKLVWEIPTRVDVRRWWDMRTIDETELRDVYGRQGYHGKDLDNYVVWTKVYTDFPDLVARYKNKWITEEEVLATLIADGMPEDRAEELLETKIKNIGKEERIAKEKDLTASDICKGVKIGRISYATGKDMLVAMLYDEQEAAFKLDVWAAPKEEIEEQVKQRDLTKADILNAVKKEVVSIGEGKGILEDMGYDAWEADVLIMLKLGITTEEHTSEIMAASPQTALQYKRLVESYKRSQGQEVVEIPPELIAMEKKLIQARQAVAEAKAKEEPQANLGQLEAQVVELELTLKEQASLLDLDVSKV